jgi:hypothetical protein
MSTLRKAAIIYQIICIIFNLFGMVIGVKYHSLALVVWCAIFGYISAHYLDKLWGRED